MSIIDTASKGYTKLVLKFIMAFGSPESAGIPRLAHVVFTSKVILNRTAT